MAANPSGASFSGLRALFLNCTLTRSPQASHTERLIDCARAIMERQGVNVEVLRPVDAQLAYGIYPDMREHGWEKDEWPPLMQKVRAADILVLGTPIWQGAQSSVCTQVIERLYASSSELNDKEQYLYYGKVAGCLVTGNEDGAQNCGRSVQYSLNALGYLIPPQALAYWVGDAGPGPSYLDPDSNSRDNDFTNRSLTFMAWNLMHLARMLKAQGGIPVHGNQVPAWKRGRHFGHPFYPADSSDAASR